MRPDRLAVDRARLLVLAGYLLAIDACYLIATSRWGSYVGVPHHPIYVGDVLFAVSLLVWALGGGPAVLWRRARDRPILWVAAALVGWTLIRLAFGAINAVALRDAAPYIYLLAVPVAMTARLPRRALLTMLVAAVALHVAWLAVTLQAPSWYASLPHLGPTRMFDLRDDYDETIAGIAASGGIVAAVYAPRLLARGAALALTGVGVWDISQMSNRGGLLAVGVCLLTAAAIIVSRELRNDAPRRPRVVHASMGLALCVAAGVGVLQSPAAQRLNDTFGTNTPIAVGPPASPTPSAHATSSPRGRTGGGAGGHTATPSPGHSGATSAATSSPGPDGSTTGSPRQTNLAAGTTAARKTAWRRVYNYTTATTSRALVGVGFGPNYLETAGARQLLSGGKPGLRAPHNILLNTWARLGVVGLLLQVALVLLGLLAAVGHALRRSPTAETGWVLVAIALPTAAMVGVIFEAPFGALPYACALGLLVASPVQRLAVTVPERERPQPKDAVRAPGSDRPAEVAP